MSAPVARSLIQPSRLLLRRGAVRHASSASEAASQGATQAKDAAQNTASKASQGLSRVSTSTTSALSKAGPALQKSLGSIGGRTGQVISFVQSLVPPTVYYSKVVFEVGRIVARGQKIQFPTGAQFQEFFQPLVNAAQNPSQIAKHLPSLASPQQYLNQVRNLSQAQLASYGIIFAELVGFFTVGEMVGRFKVVGYRGGAAHEHH